MTNKGYNELLKGITSIIEKNKDVLLNVDEDGEYVGEFDTLPLPDVDEIFAERNAMIEFEYGYSKSFMQNQKHQTIEYMNSETIQNHIKSIKKRIEKATRIETKIEKREVTNLEVVLVKNLKKGGMDVQLKGLVHFEFPKSKFADSQHYTITKHWTIEGHGLYGDTTEDLRFK